MLPLDKSDIKQNIISFVTIFMNIISVVLHWFVMCVVTIAYNVSCNTCVLRPNCVCFVFPHSSHLKSDASDDNNDIEDNVVDMQSGAVGIEAKTEKSKVSDDSRSSNDSSDSEDSDISDSEIGNVEEGIYKNCGNILWIALEYL